jgi:hypothetical protein
MHPLIAAVVTTHVIQDRREVAERHRARRNRRASADAAARVPAAPSQPAHRRRLAWKA